MFTFTVVCAVPTGADGFVVVGGGAGGGGGAGAAVVVVAGGGAGTGFTGATPTANLPFMPAWAWPGSVHRYANWPFFGNLTVSFADWPGASDFVFFPAILKSWLILPLFTTLKTTVEPAGTDRFENVNENSRAVTVIATGFAFFFGAFAAVARPAVAPAAASAVTASATTRRRIN